MKTPEWRDYPTILLIADIRNWVCIRGVFTDLAFLNLRSLMFGTPYRTRFVI